MMYRDKDKERLMSRLRMKSYRERGVTEGVTEGVTKIEKGVTEGVTEGVTVTPDVTPNVTPCENCARLVSRIKVLEGRLMKRRVKITKDEMAEGGVIGESLDLEVTEVWRTLPCPRHGRNPIGGKWLCCDI
jgi:hypothetical protein